MSAPHVHSSIYMISICCYGPSSILRQYSDVSRSYCKNSSKEIALQFNFGLILAFGLILVHRAFFTQSKLLLVLDVCKSEE